MRQLPMIFLDQPIRRHDLLAVELSALDLVLEPLRRKVRHSRQLIESPLAAVRKDGEQIALPRYIFSGPGGGGDPIRIGIFAGIHGDEPAGAYAVLQLVELLEAAPILAEGYHLFLYPVCNPTGFVDATRCSRTGRDLNREFWKNSQEPEVILLEQEIRTRAFHGLVSLHTDDTSEGLYGFVRGAVLTRALLEPALAAAEKVLPRNLSLIIDGFSAQNGIISECYDGILTSPPELHPQPFEIILETPHAAPLTQQAQALVVAIRAVLAEYQKFLAFAANL